MTVGFDVDAGVMLGGLLLIVGSVGSRLTERFRVPSLLLFLALGMLVADDGLGLIRFSDAGLAQNIAVVALVVILFEGGLSTEKSSFRVAGLPAGLLASVGVVLTASVVAAAAALVLGWDWPDAFLLGAVMSSTDAAAVFSALRNEPLPPRTLRTLQLESGLNDPVAVLLTVGMVEVWRADPTVSDWLLFLTQQITVGFGVGIAVGLAAKWMIDRAHGAASASLGTLTLAVAGVSYGLAAVLGGSGFLAVYLTGVLLAVSDRRVRGVLSFHEGLASTAQGVLFLVLGILVFPTELVDALHISVFIAAVLVFVARPLAVAAVMSWFGSSPARMVVISWAGLRGAVPVVLATIPFTAGHPDGATIFEATFVVVVLSVTLQATTVGAVARRLGVVDEAGRRTVATEIVPVDAHDADLVEVTVHPDVALVGRQLSDSPPPGGARIALIHRGASTIIPTGSTTIKSADLLLVIAPRECSLGALDEWAVEPVAETPVDSPRADGDDDPQ